MISANFWGDVFDNLSLCWLDAPLKEKRWFPLCVQFVPKIGANDGQLENYALGNI